MRWRKLAVPNSEAIPGATRKLHRVHLNDETRFHHGLPRPEAHIPSTKRLFKAGACVFHQGQLATHLFEVTSGVLMISKMTEDGRRSVVEIIPSGWICGFSSGGAYDASCDALTDSTVVAYLKTDIDKVDILEDRKRLSHQVERQICALHDRGLSLSRKTAEERVAAFLMRFVVGRGVPNCAGPISGGDGATVDIPMSGEEIGDFLGLNPETVSRTITNLETKGLIARVHGKRRHYRVTDVCSLCKAAHNDCGL